MWKKVCLQQNMSNDYVHGRTNFLRQAFKNVCKTGSKRFVKQRNYQYTKVNELEGIRLYTKTNLKKFCSDKNRNL